jgi:hypothetical protein
VGANAEQDYWQAADHAANSTTAPMSNIFYQLSDLNYFRKSYRNTHL